MSGHEVSKAQLAIEGGVAILPLDEYNHMVQTIRDLNEQVPIIKLEKSEDDYILVVEIPQLYQMAQKKFQELEIDKETWYLSDTPEHYNIRLFPCFMTTKAWDLKMQADKLAEAQKEDKNNA